MTDTKTATADGTGLRVQSTDAIPPARYEVQSELGQGAVGVVVAALDLETHRVVALKLPKRGAPIDATMGSGARTSVGGRHFLSEAQLTAQLEHPAIVPVYDLGRGADGSPDYAMRRVSSRSLKDILGESPRAWSIARLVSVLVQVTRALAYAHNRGVVHRDVKPANVLVGAYGEVYLADWGVARVTRPTDLVFVDEIGHAEEQLVGTPGYIAPEMVRGDWDHVDHRVDLFAIGVMLYQVLTGVHPFRREDVAQTMVATYEGDFPRPRATSRDCPLVLDDLCVALLERDPDQRPRTGDEVADRLEEFLAGAKEKERRGIEARRLAEHASDPLRRLEEHEGVRIELTELARERWREVRPWDPIEKKESLWGLEDRARHAENEAARALAEAIDLYTKALGYDADCGPAHSGLADVYFKQARIAESERRFAAQIHYETLVAEHDDGRYVELLRAPASISLRTFPARARVIARRWEERGRRLVEGESVDLGLTPIERAKLPAGSWCLTLVADGFRETRYPVFLRRGELHDADVNLYTESEIGNAFLYVPGGPAIIGGDADASDSLPLSHPHVADFAIARFPVTFGEYCGFLDTLSDEEADRRAPADRLSGGTGRVVERVDGRWTPQPMLIEGAARELFPESEGHLWNVPAFLVDWYDARAFTRWMDARLPTELEWEKAARGVDGRRFPWGDQFDATFCKMRDSRSIMHQPEPVGTFATDLSPYGVRDMAGGIREWVGDIAGQKVARELDDEPEARGIERGDSPWREIRSGSWSSEAKWTRCASRGGAYALTRGTGLGFRIAKSLSRTGC